MRVYGWGLMGESLWVEFDGWALMGGIQWIVFMDGN